jgi:hypothetical protein
VLVRTTTGVPTNPEPVIVLETAVAAVVSATLLGVSEATVGSLLTVKAPAKVPVPRLSFVVMGYEPGVVAAVDV